MIIIKQLATYDCALAAIAMAVQRPYDELWPAEFCRETEDAKGTFGERFDKAMQMAGLNKNTDYWSVPIPSGLPMWAVHCLLKGRRALLQVPSLNHQGAQHLVFWAGETLYDPSNKQVYGWLDHCAPTIVFIFNERG